MELRPYQQDFKNAIYKEVLADKRKILCEMFMGTGKTTVFTSITGDISANNRPVLITVKRRKLVQQASKTLQRAGISHGIFMADSNRWRPKAKVQVGSIDTIGSREAYPFKDNEKAVIIIDECHDISSNNSQYKSFLDVYSKNVTLGFTATPYGDNSAWTAHVNTITPQELLALGYLVPTRTHLPDEVEIDGRMEKVDVDEFIRKPQIVGNIVEYWKEYGEGRPTIIFANSVNHSMALQENFGRQGIEMLHADASTPERKRDQLIRRLVKGHIQGLINVGLYGVGVDIPEVSCIVQARPTTSTIWHVQSLGRGIRPAPGKRDCIVLDHCGNFWRCGGDAFEPRQVVLDKGDFRGRAFSIRRCFECGHVYKSGPKCPHCGHTKAQTVEVRQGPKERKGTLVEAQPTDKQVISLKQELYKLHVVAKRRGFGQNWKYHQLKRTFSVELLRKHAKELKLPLWVYMRKD